MSDSDKAYPRSTLLSIEPIGIDSGPVESLSSYVARLAARHDVAQCHVDAYITTNAVKVLPRGEAPIPDPRRLDAPTSTAAAYAARVARLTGRSEIGRLGLGSMCDVLVNYRTLRHHVAWCPRCVEDAHLDRAAAHMQMAWSIPEVEICTIHGLRLRTRCPGCKAKFDTKFGIPYPFQHCPHCRELLSKGDCIAAERSGKELSPQYLVAEAVQDLLTQLVRLPSETELTKPDLRRIIDSARERGLCSGTSEFCRIAGICKGTLSALMNGSPGNLALWTRVAAASDLSLPGLFRPHLWEEAGQGEAISFAHRRVKRKKVDWSALKSNISRQIKDGDAEGIVALCSRLSHDARYMRKKLGDLAGQFEEAATAMRDAHRRALLNQILASLREEAALLASANRRLSVRVLARRLAIGRNTKLFRDALALARSDPNWPLHGRRGKQPKD